MKNTKILVNENNEKISVEIFFEFEIEELGKKYVVYSLNDDDTKEEIDVAISEIDYDEDIPKIVSIPEEEKEIVLLFYNNIKDNMN